MLRLLSALSRSIRAVARRHCRERLSVRSLRLMRSWLSRICGEIFRLRAVRFPPRETRVEMRRS